MLYRIEKGGARCEIWVVSELSAILGVPPFEPELGALQKHSRDIEARLALLPKAVHAPRGSLKDGF